MPRKIRAKVEEKVDETKIMSVLDAGTATMSVPEPVIVKEQKQPKQPKQPKEPKEQKQRAPNAWLEFLKDYRMKHPEKSYKQCLQDGKTEYTPLL